MMRERALKNERDSFKTAMRMRAKRQALVVRQVSLRPVMVEEQERVEVWQARPRQWAARYEIADIVTQSGVHAQDCLVLHPARFVLAHLNAQL